MKAPIRQRVASEDAIIRQIVRAFSGISFPWTVKNVAVIASLNDRAKESRRARVESER